MIKFKPEIDKDNPQFDIIGMVFLRKPKLSEAIKSHRRTLDKNVRFPENDNARVKTICVGKIVLGTLAPQPKTEVWQIRSIQPIHKCGRSLNNKNIPCRWLAKKYLGVF